MSSGRRQELTLETERRIWENEIDTTFEPHAEINYDNICSNVKNNVQPHQYIEPEDGITNCGQTCFLNSTIHALLPIITEAVQSTKFHTEEYNVLNRVSQILQHKNKQRKLKDDVRSFFQLVNKDEGTTFGQQGAADLFARDLITVLQGEGLCFEKSLHRFLYRNMKFDAQGTLKNEGSSYKLGDDHGHMLDFRPDKEGYDLVEKIEHAARKNDFAAKGQGDGATDSYDFGFIVSKNKKHPSFLLVNAGVGHEGDGIGKLGQKSFFLPKDLNDVMVPMYVDNQLHRVPYEVTDLILHQGATFNSGHYIAVGKRWNPDKRQVDWYKYDDDDVKIVEGPLTFMRSGRQTRNIQYTKFVPLLIVLRLKNKLPPEGIDNILFTSDHQFGANDLSEGEEESAGSEEDVEDVDPPEPKHRKKRNRSLLQRRHDDDVDVDKSYRREFKHTSESATHFLLGNVLSKNPKFFNAYTFYKPNFAPLAPLISSAGGDEGGDDLGGDDLGGNGGSNGGGDDFGDDEVETEVETELATEEEAAAPAATTGRPQRERKLTETEELRRQNEADKKSKTQNHKLAIERRQEKKSALKEKNFGDQTTRSGRISKASKEKGRGRFGKKFQFQFKMNFGTKLYSR